MMVSVNSLPVPIIRVAERSSATDAPLAAPPSHVTAATSPLGASSSNSSSPNLGTKNGYPVNWHIAATSLSPPSGCVPYHINHLGRHGSRHMSKNKAPKRLVDYASRLTGASMNKTNLAQWAAAALSIEIDRDLGQLSYQGRRELAGIARRMMDNFGPLLRSGRRVRMESTAVNRAQESRATFAATLSSLGVTEIKIADAPACSKGKPPSKEHSLLYFFADCKANVLFQEAMEEAPVTQTGIAQFQQAIKDKIGFSSMIDGFLERNFPGQYIGLSSADRLQFVQALFDVCSVEMGSLGDNNDICSFFTQSEIEVFAMIDDVSNYVERGPTKLGAQISSRSACTVIRNLISNTETVINSATSDAHATDMRFAHAETLMPVLSLLGFFTDPNVDERNISAWLNPNRLWNSGTVAPMTSNLQFILYQCPAVADNDVLSSANIHVNGTAAVYRVAMMHNEKLMQAPSNLGCDNRQYCDWNRIKSWMTPMSCQYDDWVSTVCGGLADCSDD